MQLSFLQDQEKQQQEEQDGSAQQVAFEHQRWLGLDQAQGTERFPLYSTVVDVEMPAATDFVVTGDTTGELLLAGLAVCAGAVAFRFFNPELFVSVGQLIDRSMRSTKQCGD